MQDVITGSRPASSDETTDARETGRVRWFSATHGYGMVEPDEGGPDVFVEHDRITMEGFRTLEAGQCVEYLRSEDAHGPIAVDVRLC